MTDYWVNPDIGSDSNDGSANDASNAWATVSKAALTVSAGDTVFLVHGTGSDEVLSAAIDIETTAGDTTNGYVKFVGTNSSGVVDGTRYVIDGNSTATDCFDINISYQWFENIECKGAINSGFDNASTTASNNVYINCIAHGNGTYGFEYLGAYGRFILCQAYDNTNDGMLCGGLSPIVLFCTYYNNSGEGMDLNTSVRYGMFYGILLHNNTAYGMSGPDQYSLIMNCVFDGEGVGLAPEDHMSVYIGNRVTNCTTGIDFNTKLTLVGWNHFYNNTTDVVDATLAYNLPYREALTNDVMSDGIDGSNTVDTGTDDGYNDRSNDDFNLKSGAENRRIEIDLEVGS